MVFLPWDAMLLLWGVIIMIIVLLLVADKKYAHSSVHSIKK